MDSRDDVRGEIVNVLLLTEAYLGLAKTIYDSIARFKPSTDPKDVWKLVEYINDPTVRWLEVTANAYVSLAILDISNLLDFGKRNTLNLAQLMVETPVEAKIQKLRQEFRSCGFLKLRHSHLAHRSLESKITSLDFFFSTYKGGWLDNLMTIVSKIKITIAEHFPPAIGNNFFLNQLMKNETIVNVLLENITTRINKENQEMLKKSEVKNYSAGVTEQ